LKRYFSAISKGTEVLLDALGPGVRTSEIYNRTVKAVKEAGIPHYKRRHVGHGLGIEGYDYPSLGPKDETILEPDMVICHETPYYELGFGGICIENTVRITEDGYELLTETDHDLIVV